MLSNPFRATLSACPLIAILRDLTPQEAPEVGKVLWDAGFRVLDVPPNSPEPDASIAALREALLLPVGGIRAANRADYVKAGANGFGVGSSLYSPGKPIS